MRLNRSQVPQLGRQIVKSLLDAEDIEVADRREVERDIQSVLTQYLDEVDRVMSRARELVQQRGLPQGEFGRIKELAAQQAGIKVGDDGLDHVLDQLLKMLMHSSNVEEVFAEDHELRRRMREHLRGDDQLEYDIEAEVRSKLKHVQEGTRVWEIEYRRMKEEIKRRRGVE